MDIETVQDYNTEALLADGFEEAFIGISRQYPSKYLATYDYNKCVNLLIKRDGMSFGDAVEYMDFNVVGAYVGPNTPVFVWTS